MYALALTLAVAWADETKPVVREVKVSWPQGSEFPRRGGHEATVLASADGARRVLGKDLGDEVTKQVDFAREDVVLVSWRTSGPPFGVLRHEVKPKEKAVEFYVKAPPPGRPRGEALSTGLDVFAVPRGYKVSLARDER